MYSVTIRGKIKLLEKKFTKIILVKASEIFMWVNLCGWRALSIYK